MRLTVTVAPKRTGRVRNDEAAADMAHQVLSGVHIAADAAFMPLYAYMQPVCHRGYNTSRRAEGGMAGCEKDMPVPPVGRLGL